MHGFVKIYEEIYHACVHGDYAAISFIWLQVSAAVAMVVTVSVGRLSCHNVSDRGAF